LTAPSFISRRKIIFQRVVVQNGGAVKETSLIFLPNILNEKFLSSYVENG